MKIKKMERLGRTQMFHFLVMFELYFCYSKIKNKVLTKNNSNNKIMTEKGEKIWKK